MKHIGSVLVTGIYHTKPGYENQFVKLWNDKIGKLAVIMGATSVGIYHNKETEEFFSSTHWPNQDLAEQFLNSSAFKKASQATNQLCLVPVSRKMFEILHEAAA